MTRCLVLNGHPISPSFNGAVADHYAEQLDRLGVETRRMDLTNLSIPDLETRKPSDSEMVGDVALFWQEVVAAEHIVIVHPLWWGGMPAKLKALFDIALQSGKAFRYTKSPLPLGLLKGRSARLIVTSDTPHWFMMLGYASAHFKAMKNQVFKFVGLNPVRLTHLSVIRGSTGKQRNALLAKAARAAKRDARRMTRSMSRRPSEKSVSA